MIQDNKRIRPSGIAKPSGVHLVGGHDPNEADQEVRKKEKITTFSLDKWYFQVLVCADGLVILAASKETLEQTKEDLTTSFRKWNWTSDTPRQIGA